jgi:glycine/D-amino acid oxidase-like deaminating enzyme
LNNKLYSDDADNNWETRTSGFTDSSWFRALKGPLRFNKLTENLSTDVVVVGGGIAGLTTAYLLSKAGKRVVLLDDGYIASGETGRTTAHITHALDDRYYNLEKRHGRERTRLAAESHTAAINLIETIVNTEGINCDFERLDGYLFLDPTDDRQSLDKEIVAIRNAGIHDAKLIEKMGVLHRDIGPCICFPNQAQFQPLLYLAGLAKVLASKFKVNIFTETHAQEIKSEEGKGMVRTSDGFKITASYIVLATNAPIVDKISKIYDKQQPYRTYAIAANIPRNSIPKGLYWDTGNQKSKERVKPYHYVRTQKCQDDDNYDLLIVGGEDHKTGSIKDEKQFEKRFERLDNWTRNRFPVEGPLVYSWSGQVMEPADGLAFIGINPGPDKNVFIATGDSGNGITHGTIAGMILSDQILGKKNPWTGLYEPSRKISNIKGA